MHTYLDMHGRHGVCVSDVFVHMCVCVCVWGVYQLTQNRLRRHSSCCVHWIFLFFQWNKKKKKKREMKLRPCFEELLFRMKSSFFEWESISPESSAVIYVPLLLGWWCHGAEPWPHAVVGFCPLAVVFIKYLFNLSFLLNYQLSGWLQ